MRHFVLSLIISLSITAMAEAQAYIIRPYTSGSGASCAGLVTPGTFGSATLIPVLTIDANGCISVATTATPFSKGTLVANNPFEFSTTFDNAAVDFTGFKLSFTDTASGAGSSLYTIAHNGTDIVKMFGRDWRSKFTSEGWCQQDLALNDCRIIWTAVSGSYHLRLFSQHGFEIQSNVTLTNLIGNTYSPTVTGDGTEDAQSWDLGGTVTSTVTAAGTITITFGYAFYNNSHCLVTTPSGAAFTYSNSLTALTITGTFTTGQKFNYFCSNR